MLLNSKETIFGTLHTLYVLDVTEGCGEGGKQIPQDCITHAKLNSMFKPRGGRPFRYHDDEMIFR